LQNFRYLKLDSISFIGCTIYGPTSILHVSCFRFLFWTDPAAAVLPFLKLSIFISTWSSNRCCSYIFPEAVKHLVITGKCMGISSWLAMRNFMKNYLPVNHRNVCIYMLCVCVYMCYQPIITWTYSTRVIQHSRRKCFLNPTTSRISTLGHRPRCW